MAEIIAIGLQSPEAASRRLCKESCVSRSALHRHAKTWAAGKVISAQNLQPMGFSSFREFV